MNVQIVIFDGFDELDAVAPHEVWHMAKELKPEVEVQLVTLDGANEITAANGLRVRAEAKLGAKRPDILVVPGGGWIGRSPKGAWAEAQRGGLPTEIAKLHRDGGFAEKSSGHDPSWRVGRIGSDGRKSHSSESGG
jgi:hypothetical protein